MKKKALLFDADGVLIRTEFYGKYYQQKNNLDTQDMQPFYNGVFQECLIGKKDLKKEIGPWLQKWKWLGSVDEFLEEWFQYENKLDENVSRYIKELRQNDIACYLVTNQEKYRTGFMRTKMDFDNLFDGTYASSDMGVKKQDLQFFPSLLQELNLNPQDLLLIDDTPECIQSAKSAGIDGYLYSEFDTFTEFMKTSQ